MRLLQQRKVHAERKGRIWYVKRVTQCPWGIITQKLTVYQELPMVRDPFDDDFFKEVFKRLKEFDKEFEKIEKNFRIGFKEFEQAPGISGFRIEIRGTGRGAPEVKVSRIGESSWRVPKQVHTEPYLGVHPVQEKKQYRPIKKMLETDVCKVEKPDEVVITMKAPGVSRDEVEVRRAGNAMEVIARKPTGEAYFCTAELPWDARLNEKKVEFKGDLLMVIIPRGSKVR